MSETICVICLKIPACALHNAVKYEPWHGTEYCETCQTLCVEHRVYGERGRPQEIEYGKVFKAAFDALFDTAKSNYETDPLELLLSEDIKASINSVQTANLVVGENRMDWLKLWLFDAISPYPQIRALSHWDDDIDLDGGEDWRVYLAEFANHRNDKTHIAATIARVFAERRQIAFKVLSLAEAYDDGRAGLVGIEAYIESAAIIGRFLRELHPSDFAHAMTFYYLGRKTEDDGKVGEGKELLYSGSLYRKVNARYHELRDVDRELICDEYCDAFIEALDRIPVEALLNPSLAVAWALTAADWAAGRFRKSLNRRLEVLWDHEPAAADVYDGSSLIIVEILRECESLPDYDLALRHFGYNTSLADLSGELGISKQAVHKRIKKLIAAAQHLHTYI